MKYTLPAQAVVPGAIEKVAYSDSVAFGTTSGLESSGGKNRTNEDRVGCLVGEPVVRICIADGH
jgi:hypothetical protein